MIAKFEVVPNTLNILKFTVDHQGNVHMFESKVSATVDLNETVKDFLFAAEISLDDLRMKSRKHNYVFVRYIFCKLCFQRGFRERDIAYLLQVDRTTVLHAIASFDELLAQKWNRFMNHYNRIKPHFPEL